MRERGSASVYGAIALATAGLAAALALWVVSLVGHVHQSSRAADLAALAASGAAVAGRDGCEAARLVAGKNDARVVGCSMRFEVATVTTRVSSPEVWGLSFAFDRRARAAPSDLAGGGG